MNARQVTSLFALSVLIGWTSSSSAAIVNLGRWDGAIELGARYSSVETEAVDGVSNGAETETTISEQRIRLRNSGSLVDRRLVTYSAGGTFGWAKEDYRSGVNGSSASERDGDLSGYDFRVGILPGTRRLSAELFANRNRFVQTRELGGRSHIDAEAQGATLRAAHLYLPSMLSVQRVRSAQQTRFGSSVTETDERRDLLRYEGLRGWLNKQMALRYEMLDRSDRFRPQFDYRSKDVSLSTDVDFGPELNRRWQSSVRGGSRSGFSAQERFQTTQVLQIRHGRGFKTSSRYYLDDVERSGGSVRTQTASVSLSHALYQSLTTELGFFAGDASFDDGQRDVYGGNLRLRYRKRLPWSGVLNASFRTSKRREDSDFEEAFVPQERHAFEESSAQPVFLENPNVIGSSVEVTKVSNGPPVPGCADLPAPTLLVEGVDYTLRQVGRRTEIVPEICSATTAGISPGDTIAVDYRFTQGGEPVAFDTDIYRWQASIDYGWIRPYFNFERQDQDIVSGIDRGFLTDRRATTVGIEFRGGWKRLAGSLRAETQNQDSDDLGFDRDLVTAQLRYQISRSLRLSANGTINSTRYSFPELRETDFFLLLTELNYARNGSLNASIYARLQEFDDTRVLDERRMEAGLRARWRLGKLSVNGTVGVANRQRGGRDSRDLRVMLQVRRSFDWR